MKSYNSSKDEKKVRQTIQQATSDRIAMMYEIGEVFSKLYSALSLGEIEESAHALEML